MIIYYFQRRVFIRKDTPLHFSCFYEVKILRGRIFRDFIILYKRFLYTLEYSLLGFRFQYFFFIHLYSVLGLVQGVSTTAVRTACTQVNKTSSFVNNVLTRKMQPLYSILFFILHLGSLKVLAVQNVQRTASKIKMNEVLEDCTMK